MSDDQTMPQQPAWSLALFYSISRIAMFIVFALVFKILGLAAFPAMIAGAVLSVPVSYVALKGVRTRLAERMQNRQTGKKSIREEFRTAGVEPDDVK